MMLHKILKIILIRIIFMKQQMKNQNSFQKMKNFKKILKMMKSLKLFQLMEMNIILIAILLELIKK